MFPETKRMSAEDASRVFDFDRHGTLLGEGADDGNASGIIDTEKQEVQIMEKSS
jgi:hypothetical protein